MTQSSDSPASRSLRRRQLAWLWAVATLALALTVCDDVRHAGIATFAQDHAEGASGARANVLQPSFEGADAEQARIEIVLVEVASGFKRPTDLQFVPGKPDTMLVLEQPGTARWVSLRNGKHGQWLALDVLTVSEQGLLGMAFHPRFRDNGMLYLNATVEHAGQDASEISAWRASDPAAFLQRAPERERVLLRVRQPYQNHNAGQLQFGPDGYLYIGFGDGGYRGDPHGHGQNTETFLGSMLRVDVDATRSQGDGAYGIPDDNPFIGRKGFRPEIWAYGLRNPWRYSFDQAGRLVVADVGQDAWEEIDIVAAGDNLGWNIMEGRHCYDDDERCGEVKTVAPVYEYSHGEGQSITGGYVYTGERIDALQGLYVFGDFVSGRLWALELPDTRRQGEPPRVRALGKWPIQPVTFGRDAAGELYVADYAGGTVYRLASPAPSR